MTQELLPCQLHSLFDYNSFTGELTWKLSSSKKMGRRAGSIDSKGRLRIEINSKTYAAHHIVWAMSYGVWPSDQLDHINQDKLDNRLENLREATNAQNSRNRKSKNQIAKGVSFHKVRYIARIMVDGKAINLGSYNKAEEAANAYELAAKQHHGEYACLSN